MYLLNFITEERSKSVKLSEPPESIAQPFEPAPHLEEEEKVCSSTHSQFIN